MTNLHNKSNKRWGKKFIDEREWPIYNEALVKQGEYLLALDFVENWNKELADMNSRKKGAPFKFPKTLIELQSIWHAKRIPYRMIEGMTRDLVKLGGLPEYNDYSTANRRVNKLEFRLALPQGDSIRAFGDGTGLQAINGGEYLREKYGKKNRRWIQIVLLGDAEHHEPISYEIRLIPESESKSTKNQLKTLHAKNIQITSFGGDGAFDDKDLWNYLDQKNIKPLIKPDKNALENTNCWSRNVAVKKRNKLGHKKWSRETGYGHRWPSTEGIFSALKRMFSEQLAATSEQGMLHEAACKIWAYQKLKRYGEATA
jgi:hypothetical protein